MSDSLSYKKCLKCLILKTLESFSKQKNKKDGLQCYCKICIALYKKGIDTSHTYRSDNKKINDSIKKQRVKKQKWSGRTTPKQIFSLYQRDAIKLNHDLDFLNNHLLKMLRHQGKI